ncbi:MAG: efflux RND transporter permease subunit, partial [Coriobacteriia bacterium]|nr:efflux RND transporter permease subunit [Coriobacteriia bacterium]
MDRITRFSLKNSVVIIIAIVMVVVGGVYSSTQLKKETMPDISIPIVAIVTPYPGAAPADVHDKVTQPIERAIDGVDGLKTVQSSSSDSVSVVVAEFGYSTDMDTAESAINELLKTLELPDNVMESSTRRVSMGSQP